MAQHINIPIAFEWHPYPASWKIATATITGWKPRSKKTLFQATVEQRGARFLVDLNPWQLLRTLKSLQENTDNLELVGYPVELLVCSVKLHAWKRQDDPWAMREEFLRLKRDTKALLGFLNKWGIWGPTETSVTFIPAGADPPIPKKVPLLNIRVGGIGDGDESMKVQVVNRNALYYLLPAEIWEFQKECRTGLNKPAEKWLSKHSLRRIYSRREYPHYVLSATSCRRAVLDTIVIDHLRKVQFSLCARPDCRTPFAIGTRHQREYCCQYCAHIESVRKQRAVKKEALRKGR
jgi:hypothetical protein